MVQENLQAAARDVGREHFREHGEGDAGLVAEFGDGAVAGVEERVGARGSGERKMPRVVVAHPAAEGLVAFRAAEGLDQRMFVGRDGLRRELAAEPIGFLGQDHPEARARRGEGGGEAPQAAADDDEIGGEFAGGDRGPDGVGA